MRDDHARIHELSQALEQRDPDEPPPGDQALDKEKTPMRSEGSASEQALATQGRMLETGEENPIS